MAQIKSIYDNEFVDGFARENMITKPTTAEVGQMLVVKAVDENGVPTEWEVTDVASGGSETSNYLLVDFTTKEEVSDIRLDLTDEQIELFNNFEEMFATITTLPTSDETITNVGKLTFGIYYTGGNYVVYFINGNQNKVVQAYGGTSLTHSVYVKRTCTPNKDDAHYIGMSQIYKAQSSSAISNNIYTKIGYDMKVGKHGSGQFLFRLNTDTKFGVGTNIKIYVRS